MPWIIRDAGGNICGRFTNKPGPGNKLPDGSDEKPEFLEEDTPESLAFHTRPIPVAKTDVQRLVDQLKTDPQGKAALKSEIEK